MIVIEARYGAAGSRDLDLMIAQADIELVALDAGQAGVARQAFSRFGRGRHPAGLDYGDCFAYALARVRGQHLLCKGTDFERTDLTLAVPGATP